MTKNLQTQKPEPVQKDFLPDFEAVPSWLPNESVYSLASRYHRLSGNPAAQYTSIRLFGAIRQGYQHDFPSGMDYFHQVTRGKAGSLNSMIYKHTILSYFPPFKSKVIEDNSITSMASPHIASLKFRLGLLTSRFGASHPLKVCRKCAEHDRNNHGTAYWHVDHQYPSVWVCLEHGTPLIFNALKTAGISRFDWILPNKDEFDLQHYNNLKVHSSELNALLTLAKASVQMSKLPIGQFLDPIILLRTYKYALVRKDLATPSGGLKLSRVGIDFLEFCRQFHSLPFYENAFPLTAIAAGNHAARLLRTPRSHTHPIRHLLLIIWLFDSWAIFWRSYQLEAVSTHLRDNQNLQESGNALTNNKNTFLTLLENEKVSITEAARKVGIDVYTGLGWSKESNRQSVRRPKKLRGAQLEKFTELIKDGKDKQNIANACNVTVQTVSRFLRSNPELQTKWMERRFLIKQSQERTRWESLTENISSLGINQLRALEPATYAWLYRHDSAWLDKINSRFRTPKKGNNTNIDWDKRDSELSSEIEKMAYQFLLDNSQGCIKISDLYLRIPGLREKISYTDKLPRSHKVLAKLLRLK